MTPAPSSPFPRTYLPWLALLLVVHAAILGWAAYGPASAPLHGFRLFEFVVVALSSLAIATIVFALSARHARAIACASALIGAAALMRPGPVLVGLLGMLNAYVVGASLLRLTDRRQSEPLPFSIAILTGVCLWLGIIAATAPFKIHYPPVYTAALLFPLALMWRDTRDALRGAVRVFRPSERLPSATERGWMALLQMTLVLHLFLVARPEVGYDATAMHLQVPLLVESMHRFPFDVTRYAWAVMPLGADWAYTASFLVGGEQAARFTNLCFGALACHLLYVLVRRHARPELALASVTLVASTPMAFLETSSLYIDSLWSAFLLASLFVALELARADGPRPRLVTALAFMVAGSLQTKTIAVVWVAPLLLYVLASARPWSSRLRLDPAGFAWVALAVLLAAWPYVNAWWRTGNPVFPFMNAWFGSPLFDATTSFTNPRYLTPLRPWSLYDTIVAGARFGEGRDGAIGFHWLLLLPLVFVALLRPHSRELRWCAGLATIFFVAVFTQQAYLRYLLPAFLVLAVLGGWAAAGLSDRRATRVAVLAIGTVLCMLHLRVVPAGSWDNSTLCARCSWDPASRDEFVATYMPHRTVSEFLNRNLPKARVGFFVLNGPSPAGFVGYSRAANWHDVPMHKLVFGAKDAREVAAAARQFDLDYAVFNINPVHENLGIRAFRMHGTTPIWQFQDFIVARINPTAP